MQLIGNVNYCISLSPPDTDQQTKWAYIENGSQVASLPSVPSLPNLIFIIHTFGVRLRMDDFF